MQVAHCLPEVKVIVWLGWGDTHVSRGREAPICGGDLVAAHGVGKARDGSKYRIREAVLKPGDLLVEVDGAPQLLNRQATVLVEVPQNVGDAPAVSRGRVVSVRRLGCESKSTRGQLEQQICLL